MDPHRPGTSYHPAPPENPFPTGGVLLIALLIGVLVGLTLALVSVLVPGALPVLPTG